MQTSLLTNITQQNKTFVFVKAGPWRIDRHVKRANRTFKRRLLTRLTQHSTICSLLCGTSHFTFVLFFRRNILSTQATSNVDFRFEWFRQMNVIQSP